MLECVQFVNEDDTHILHEYNLDFEGDFFHVQHLSLFSDIYNCNYFCT